MHPREYEAALGFRENKESLHSSPNAARRRAEAYGFVPETQNPKNPMISKCAVTVMEILNKLCAVSACLFH